MKRNHIILIFSIGIVLIASIYVYYRVNKFQSKIVRIAKSELNKWVTLSEVAVNASKQLLAYWKSVGFKFTEEQMQSEDFQSSYPWSSAFISYLFYKAGAKDKFPYSSAHSGYFQQAKKDRNKDNAPLKGFRITEYAPKVGDLVVYTRQTGKGYDSTGFFPSHGELVVEKGKGYIKAIGGNVSNTVKMSTYTTDKNGKITQKEKPFFMVIENNIK